jgi:UDPglucose 6-dehydrogenase
MKVAMVGAGYVGLVSGVCIAHLGHDVVCVEKNGGIVASLQKGQTHFYEAGLSELLSQNLVNGRIIFTSQILEAVVDADIIMIAVGTPSQVDGGIDLSSVVEICVELADIFAGTLRGPVTLAIKSTVLPGTTDTLIRGIFGEKLGELSKFINLAMNPEFLREGSAVSDFMYPDRIVIGADDAIASSKMAELYCSLDVPKIFTSTRTAEMTKYVNNVTLATQISMFNEFARIAEAIGNIDFRVVTNAVHADKRWNNASVVQYLSAGCGFGGSCFPKDLRAMQKYARDYRLDVPIISAVLDINDSQPTHVINALKVQIPKLSDQVVLLLGFAFKEGTSDTRESPGLKMVDLLASEVGQILVHDPLAIGVHNKYNEAGENQRVEFVSDWETALSRASIVVLANPGSEYRRIPQLVTDQYVIDPRSFFSPSDFRCLPYYSVGTGWSVS